MKDVMLPSVCCPSVVAREERKILPWNHSEGDKETFVVKMSSFEWLQCSTEW
jgi:hypothetical protein